MTPNLSLIDPGFVGALPTPAVPCGLYNLETYSTDDGWDGSYNGFHNITETGKTVSQVKIQLYRNGSPGTNVIALKIWETSVVQSIDNTDGYTFNDLGTSIENRTVVTFDIDPAYTLTSLTRLVVVPQSSGATMPRTGILSQSIGSFKLTVSYNSGASWTDSASWDILGCITEG
tara:strand:+ start:479 stop:1000 length:522 start_codon:yes stop_codon:yes gene_type:complete